MSRAVRNRGKNRQPYSWLGAGAITLGLGAAMVGGTAVAFADAGTDAADNSANSANAAPSGSSAKSDAGPSRKRAGTRAARSVTAPGNDAPTAAPKSRASVTSPDVSTGVDVALEAASQTPPAAAAVATPQRAARAPQKTAAASTGAASAASTPLPAAVPPPPPSPSYNTTSYLPATPIVPGAHVAAALSEISQAQAVLNQETWGSGNILAGLVSIVPQVFLAQAALSLNAWGAVMPISQQLLAATASIPIIEQIAQVGVLASMTLPSFAGIGFGGASLFLPLINMLGAAVEPARQLIEQARSDGQVYAIVPVEMKATTEPTVGVKINGGPSTSVLVDSGSSGLLVTRDAVGGNLGDPIGEGFVSFSGDASQTFYFHVYNLSVDLGGAAVTTPTPVNVVDPEDEAAYKAFLAPAGVTGIFGIGANTYGPNRNTAFLDPATDYIPNVALPGELGDGTLLFQDLFFGLFGVMVLGPNPLPTRVSVPGAPDANLKVSINGGAKQNAYGIIDSGGVYGTLPQYLINGGSSVPNGTVISVYSSDGSTLLYSYTTSSSNTPVVIGDGTPEYPPLMNTGYTPFSQGPIYLNYAAPNGIGSTDFSIW